MAIRKEAVCVAPTGDRCGEGAVWHATEQAIYWTDINRFLIHRFEPLSGCVRSWFFNEPVTAVVLTDRDDTLAVALGSRLILWRPQSDARIDHTFQLKGWPAVRLNDGRADPRGSLWLGSMRNNVGADGSEGEAGGTDGVLQRIDPDGTITEWRRELGISNTIAWSPDQTRFYSADTLLNELRVYDYDKRTGAIGGERPFLRDFPRGSPDGSTVDSEGYVWNCRYGGGCIVRLAPDGTIDRLVEMPTKNVTTCTFGGPDLRTLYVTTAAGSVPANQVAGGLFAIETEAPGQPENRFRVFGM